MGAATQQITYEDPDGKIVTEEWYFQLDESDAAEIDMVHELIKMDDPAQYLRDIVVNKDSKALLALWRELLLGSVSKREGNLLVKGPEIVREFRFGGAYRVFFSELIQSDDAGASFFTKIMPKRIQDQATEKAKELQKSYTNDELLAMSDDDFYSAAGTSDLREMDKRFMTLAMNRLSNQKGAASQVA